jgi:cyclic pyranopterin phosphate synthase
MPVGESSGIDGAGWGKKDVIASEEVIEIINTRAQAEGMGALIPAAKQKPEGWGPARYFAFEGAQGTVGFISPLSRHFCTECNRLRLTADGKLRACLFSDEEFDVREALRGGSDEAVQEILEQVLMSKPDEHHDKVGTARGMSQIGG